MKDIYTYQIGENLYINLTNRCTNRCTFCVRDLNASYEGYSLWLKGGEPTVEEITAEIGDPCRFHEVVFCGYGEPTFRLKEVKAIADYIHARGGKTRLNTNGHGGLINGRNIAVELINRIDGVNISLNAPTEGEYNEICRPQKDGAFGAVLSFARDLKQAGVNAWFSVVDCIGEDKIDACRQLAQEIGIPLRVRELIK